jgi:subfamily B ATP-binding cassette protein MsbA
MVVDHGSIIERGSHKALLEKGGAYKNLYDMQFDG